MEISKVLIPYTLLVSSREIEAGDTLAADCFTRDNQKVASEGDEVDKKLKQQMKQMGVRKAWLEREVTEWMPLVEAKLKSCDIIETYDVSPLHYQILTNFQGTFSTNGIESLLERILEANTNLEDEKLKKEVEEISSSVDRLERREQKLKDKINKIENDDLKKRYYQILSEAKPQAVNPSDIEDAKSALGRKIQSFLEKLNGVKSRLSEIILNMNEADLISFFSLENLGEYDSSPDFADSFVLFERMFSQTDHEDEETINKLFETTRRLLHEMFYERRVDSDKLQTIDSILWDNFDPELAHWFMGLGQPSELESYLLAHGVNTAILVSQLYEKSNKEPENDTVDITLSCITKDIGMVLVPQSYHLHQEDLSEEQQRKLKIHPLTSREFLEDLDSDYSETNSLIENHHEKIDGSGYPRGVKKLGPDQRLISVCDMFDAMTSPRMWRSAIPPNEAMKYLREDAGQSLDTDWVNLLIQEIGIFPVGTVVRLSNQEPSVVVENTPANPGSPRVVPVKKLMQGNGELEVIDLESSDLEVQAGGTSRKAPLAIRQKFTQNDQIRSRFIKSA